MNALFATQTRYASCIYGQGPGKESRREGKKGGERENRDGKK